MKAKSDYFSIPKAAKTCGVNRATMWNWVKSGRIAAFVTPGGHHRILRADMEKFLTENRISGEVRPAERTILIVDDDSLLRDTLKEKLERKNYRVETAEDGFKAGLSLSMEKPALVILDLFMEGMDGFEVCRTIKQNKEFRHIKVLAITGFDTPENRTRILREGADDYLAKTADFKTVLQRIELLLDQKA